jgi:NADH-quinone oxidoreductase subunit F
MPGTTICGLADGAGWPVKNAIQKFRGELEEYIQKGQKSRGFAPASAHQGFPLAASRSQNQFGG